VHAAVAVAVICPNGVRVLQVLERNDRLDRDCREPVLLGNHDLAQFQARVLAVEIQIGRVFARLAVEESRRGKTNTGSWMCQPAAAVFEPG